VSPKLGVELERERYAPGDGVRGTVTVLEGGGSRKLEVVLAFREQVGDYEHTATTIDGGELHGGDLALGASYGFEVALPDDALPSYRSRHGELYWELEVRSDERGRDTRERRRVEVAR
jgi:hypothetical protein